VGRLKDKMIEDQEAGECPECGAQCKKNDDRESYCPECDVSYAKHCTNCGSPHNNEMAVCSGCFKHAVGKD